MNTFIPEYYTKFRCIADKCHHSCCIGWEIDIDEDTLEYYKTIDGCLGERLKNSIVYEDETAHFSLDKSERCPFLNSDGLCDIITQLGENALCQICNDHPRFRNFYSERTEIGLGMCCEAAAELILSYKEKFNIVCIENDGEELLYLEEEELISVRDSIFEILTDRNMCVDNRVEKMLDFCEVSLPQKSLTEWADIYKSLERLDESWTKMLEELRQAEAANTEIPCNTDTETAFEQLLCYFIYRHLTESLDDDRLWERVAFAAQSYRIVRSLCGIQYHNAGKLTVKDISEIVRIYSSEIEYSEDNMEKLLEILCQR